jgi:hypothetical protein
MPGSRTRTLVSAALGLVACLSAPAALAAGADAITVVQRQVDVNPGETDPCTGALGTKRKRVVGTRFLVMRSEIDPKQPDKDFLQGRHVIVDASLRTRSGAISFDTNWCTRNRIP